MKNPNEYTMTNFLNTSIFWQQTGFAIIRIITGLLMVYHGWEIFDAAKMKEYSTWAAFNGSSVPGYVGKGAELLGGLLLALGLFTRLGSLLIAGTMLYISFFLGNGKVWYEDQHPFLFVLLALIYFFMGPGKWSLDALFFSRSK